MTANPIWNSQGLLLDRILVSEKAYQSTDLYLICDNVTNFLRSCRKHFGFVRGEYPDEAHWSMSVDFYLGEVRNGGHWQYIVNCDWDSNHVNDCLRGLVAMGAEQHQRIFSKLMHVMADNPDYLISAQAYVGGIENIPQSIRDLDNQFFKLADEGMSGLSRGRDQPYAPLGSLDDDQIDQRKAAWVRSLSCLEVVAPERLRQRMNQIARTNPMRKARLQELNLYEGDEVALPYPEEHLTDWSPEINKTAEHLCLSIGIDFGSILGGRYYAQDDTTGYLVETSIGDCAMLILHSKGRCAMVRYDDQQKLAEAAYPIMPAA